jgi:hypothetical protein
MIEYFYPKRVCFSYRALGRRERRVRLGRRLAAHWARARAQSLYGKNPNLSWALGFQIGPVHVHPALSAFITREACLELNHRLIHYSPSDSWNHKFGPAPGDDVAPRTDQGNRLILL